MDSAEVLGYKINMQKSVVFWYTDNEQSEVKTKEITTCNNIKKNKMLRDTFNKWGARLETIIHCWNNLRKAYANKSASNILRWQFFPQSNLQSQCSPCQNCQLNGHEFVQTQGDSEGQWSLACCNPWSCKDLEMTELLNSNIKILKMCFSEIKKLIIHLHEISRDPR